MTMSWILRAVDNGTEISIVCENVPAGISEHDHAEGLQSSLVAHEDRQPPSAPTRQPPRC